MFSKLVKFKVLCFITHLNFCFLAIAFPQNLLEEEKRAPIRSQAIIFFENKSFARSI